MYPPGQYSLYAEVWLEGENLEDQGHICYLGTAYLAYGGMLLNGFHIRNYQGLNSPAERISAGYVDEAQIGFNTIDILSCLYGGHATDVFELCGIKLGMVTEYTSAEYSSLLSTGQHVTKWDITAAGYYPPTRVDLALAVECYSFRYRSTAPFYYKYFIGWEETVEGKEGAQWAQAFYERLFADKTILDSWSSANKSLRQKIWPRTVEQWESDSHAALLPLVARDIRFSVDFRISDFESTAR
jgi:hypothetical protein